MKLIRSLATEIAEKACSFRDWPMQRFLFLLIGAQGPKCITIVWISVNVTLADTKELSEPVSI